MEFNMLGYDRAITIFSPDGRLLQVEYAFKAVNNGTIALGARFRNGVVLMGEKISFSKLQISDEGTKVFKIDDYIGATFSGMAGDVRMLIKRAITECQRHRILYGEPIDLKTLTERIGDIMQLYTQYGGTRPFGVAIIFGGIDKTGKRVFMVDPSGAITEYKAVAIGMHSSIAMEILEKEYNEDYDVREGAKFCVDVIKRAFEKDGEKFDEKNLEIAIIEEGKGFYRVRVEEL